MKLRLHYQRPPRACWCLSVVVDDPDSGAELVVKAWFPGEGTASRAPRPRVVEPVAHDLVRLAKRGLTIYLDQEIA